MAGINPSADEIRMAIVLLAETKSASANIKVLEKDLKGLESRARLTKAALTSLFNNKLISADQFNRGVERANQVLGQTAPASAKATKGLFSLNNVARTALGTLEAMAIFFIAKFVGQAITKTIEGLKQLELSFYRLGIAERSLSAAGVEISPEQLVNIANEVVATYKTVSQIDALKMISNLSVLTKDLKLTATQYEKIALAIPLIAQQSDVSIESATDQIIQGLTKSGRGWADLGITVDAAIIKQEAISSKLVESEEAYNNLTAAQKQQIEVLALINILNRNAMDNLQGQDVYLDSVAGKQALLNKEWETFTANLGVAGSPAIKSGLDTIIWFVQQMILGVELLRQGYVGWMTIFVGGMTAMRGLMSGNIKSISEFAQLFRQASKEAKTIMESIMIPEIPQDTPTASIGESEILSTNEDLQKALEKMNNEILEAQLKLAQDMEDAAIDLGRKLEDIAIEYAQKRADAERDYASKVRDIQAQYASTLASIAARQQESNQQARNEELEREAKFQEQMRQLKEKFLMDLEEALHARDARQVLRLIKQYALDKAQAKREKELEEENAKREQEARNKRFAQEREAAERERQEKLAAAAQDYADKIAKLAADEAAERAAAELSFQRKKEDLEREMQNRLEIVAANLIAEFNLTKEGLDAIVALYHRYYAEVAAIYAAMNSMLAGQGALQPQAPSLGGGGGGGGMKKAEGGMVLANRPTTATFGEAGLEMATFTPIGKQGQDVNKLFSNLSGGSDTGGGGGSIGLEVLLSPDLEARIVKNTLNKTAQVFVKAQRTKS